MAENDFVEEHGAVAALLAANGDRRAAAEAEVAAVRDEFRTLLFRGQAATMEVADMADAAGVSRDTVHSILKEGGVMSWKQKQAWAAEVMEVVPRGSFEQNEFRMFLQIYLYKALGSNPEGVPRSVEGVLEAAMEAMRTAAGQPNFTPTITDPERLRSFTWPKQPFEIIQRGSGDAATFQVLEGGVAVGPIRTTAEDIARDIKAAGGTRPAFIDRTGPECVTQDRRRIGWDVLRDV